MICNYRQGLSIAIITLAAAACATVIARQSPHTGASTQGINGTWTGQSVCVGNRPACKNEEIVYRFVAVPGKVDTVTLYGDKILNGERVPMGKFDCNYDAAKGTLSCEFTRRQTHGIWRYQISGDALEGDLMLLPNKDIGRTVKAHRVDESKVPKAPPLVDYEG
ncbi:MAG: hypothetical protein QOE77_942 [Blastocatellia bacterium]|jgi:hypothetical protein|nr:hypothetical protein [Blastocatellia bacterium]